MTQHLLALLFPGQGSQTVGMGKDLCERFPAAAEVFAQADQILGFALSRICFEGPPEVLNDTINTQPAILITSVATLTALRDQLGDPAFVAGHSLGEFSALVAAGALAFDQVLPLVRERGRLMQEAGKQSPGGMAAIIGLDTVEVKAVCAQVRETSGGYVGIANDNCPGQVVISGDLETLQIGMEAMKEAGARKVIRLSVSIAAHSPLMAQAAAAFRQELEAIPLQPPNIPVIVNATASPLTDPDEIRQALGQQLTSPVHWNPSIRWMIDQGVTHFTEVGPGEVLTGLVRRIDRSTERMNTSQMLSELGQGDK